jgi:uncharacterized protein (TIGR03118 family)
MVAPLRAGRFAAIVGLTFVFVSAAFAQHYTRTDLTTDSSAVSSAPNIDPNLVNPWGLSRSQGSPWWIADNHSGLSTLYDGSGVTQALVVNVAPPKKGTPPSAPTGTVFNYTTSFEVAAGAPALFLFVTEDGTISGWSPAVDLNNSILKVDGSTHAIYKGCAIATTTAGPRLYATNFQTGNVEVYDGNFSRVKSEETFKVTLPPHYVPFGIQNVGGDLVVTYAQRNPGEEDENHGAGLGFVVVFDTAGHILLHLQHGSYLNAPWGIALAPGDFGTFSHRLLIGNFGDGTINAFNAISGKFEGTVLDPSSGAPLSIEGLWALSFGGNGAGNGSATDLYFSAGPNDESNGVFGKLTAVGTEQRGNSE